MNIFKAFIAIVSVFVISFLLVVAAAHAGTDVTFVWDANTEADLAGYRLYHSAASGQYEYGAEHCVASVPAGTETVTHHNVADGTWYWVVTAFDNNGNESGPSNEVTDTLDATAPDPPENFLLYLIKKVLAWIGGLFGAFRLT